MSGDPHSRHPDDPWVTSAPAHGRSGELPPEGYGDPRPIAASPHGAQWGLTALIIGAPLLVAAAVQLQLNRNFWTLGPHGMKLPVAFAATLGSAILILGLGGAGIAFGVRGWLLSVSERQPIALSLGGTLLNGAAFLLWLFIYIDLVVFFFDHMH
jgi:hypothetical protein